MKAYKPNIYEAVTDIITSLDDYGTRGGAAVTPAEIDDLAAGGAAFNGISDRFDFGVKLARAGAFGALKSLVEDGIPEHPLGSLAERVTGLLASGRAAFAPNPHEVFDGLKSAGLMEGFNPVRMLMDGAFEGVFHASYRLALIGAVKAAPPFPPEGTQAWTDVRLLAKARRETLVDAWWRGEDVDPVLARLLTDLAEGRNPKVAV